MWNQKMNIYLSPLCGEYVCEINTIELNRIKLILLHFFSFNFDLIVCVYVTTDVNSWDDETK